MSVKCWLQVLLAVAAVGSLLWAQYAGLDAPPWARELLALVAGWLFGASYAEYRQS